MATSVTPARKSVAPITPSSAIAPAASTRGGPAPAPGAAHHLRPHRQALRAIRCGGPAAAGALTRAQWRRLPQQHRSGMPAGRLLLQGISSRAWLPRRCDVPASLAAGPGLGLPGCPANDEAAFSACGQTSGRAPAPRCFSACKPRPEVGASQQGLSKTKPHVRDILTKGMTATGSDPWAIAYRQGHSAC